MIALKVTILYTFYRFLIKLSEPKLIEELKRLKVIVAMYRNTSFLFKQIVINANRGVKQGSATNCFLFIIYVDCMVRKIKESFAVESFVGAPHIVMFMDDTGWVCRSTAHSNVYGRHWMGL